LRHKTSSIKVIFKEAFTDEKLENVIDVLSDSMFNYAIDETARLRASHQEAGPTYYYYLSYSSKHTLARFSNNGTVRDQPRAPLRFVHYIYRLAEL